MEQYLLNILSSFTTDPVLIFFLPRILVTLICGTIIGFEREIFSKSAGMKTLMLVSLGSTLFSGISIYLSLGHPNVDQSRVIAQIVSGIGFLGAGVILQNKKGVIGLTSAANIWFSGAVGTVVGMELYRLGIILTLISVTFLISYRLIEEYIPKIFEPWIPQAYQLSISLPMNNPNYETIKSLLRNNNAVLKYSSIKREAQVDIIEVNYITSPKNQGELIKKIMNLDVVSFKISEEHKE